MRKYELVTILPGDIGEARTKDECAKISSLLESKGCKDVQVDRWGARALGHRMRKQAAGYYASFKFTAENHGVIDELTAQFRISDAVLRFQFHKVSDKKRKFKGNMKLVAAASSEGEEALETEAEFLA